MARIAGIDLPKNKGVVGLTYIFGIGRVLQKDFKRQFY